MRNYRVYFSCGFWGDYYAVDVYDAIRIGSEVAKKYGSRVTRAVAVS